MPRAKSEAQRKFIFATKGAAFAKKHHFDNKGALPARVRKAKSLRRPSGFARKKAMMR